MIKRFLNKYGIRILAVLSLISIAALISYYEYIRKHQDDVKIRSQYTFTIRINSELEVIDENKVYSAEEIRQNPSEWISSLPLADAARIWMSSYLAQMEGRLVPNAKAVRNPSVNSSTVLNSNEKTVLLGFSAEALNKESNYFDSWKGYVSDGKMMCEWVVAFEIEDLYDGTAKIRPLSIRMPSEYGLDAYTPGGRPVVSPDQDKLSDAELYRYQFADGKIQITFDGGEKWVTVPVESAYLLQSYSNKGDNTTESKRVVDEGVYVIDSQGAAFLYGGVTVNGSFVPLTVLYTKDRGENWISAQVSDISDLNFAYMNFFTEDTGIIVAGCEIRQNYQSSAIYKTDDGGENWEFVGETPFSKNIIGAVFYSETTGFISYEHDAEMISTLVSTYDGGRTFSAVQLEEQQLSDNAGSAYRWNQVYIQANTPVRDLSGRLTLLVTQGPDSTYYNPTLAARYTSDDNGKTWQYVDQVDTQVK